MILSIIIKKNYFNIETIFYHTTRKNTPFVNKSNYIPLENYISLKTLLTKYPTNNSKRQFLNPIITVTPQHDLSDKHQKQLNQNYRQPKAKRANLYTWN